MGGILSRKAEKRILFLGLDNAGKTTLVKYFKSSQYSGDTIPTLGFGVENVSTKKFTFHMWDVGGQDNIRHLWHHYLQGTDALVYVIDSVDAQRFEIAADSLKQVASDPDLQGISILLLCNKADLPGAMPPNEISVKMGLNSVKQKWSSMAVSAKTGEGCEEVIMWLTDNLKK